MKFNKNIKIKSFNFNKLINILQVWLIIPAFCFLASIFLVVAPIIEQPKIENLYAACFILAGYIFYIPFVHFRKTLPCIGYKVTCFLIVKTNL